MKWGINGKWFEVVFPNFTWMGGLRPSMCASPTFTAKFIFGEDPESPLRYPPPEEDYKAVGTLITAYRSTRTPEDLALELLPKEEEGGRVGWVTRSGYPDTSIDVVNCTILATQNYPTVFLSSEAWVEGTWKVKIIMLEVPTVKQVCLNFSEPPCFFFSFLLLHFVRL
jgi:hypothetical protein